MSGTSSAAVISRRLFRLLNNQGNREFEASMMYSAFSAWFRHNKLPGSTAWCVHHAGEERVHAQKIFHHLSRRRVEAGEEEEEVEDVERGGGGGGETTAGARVARTLLPPRIYRTLGSTTSGIPLQSEPSPEWFKSFEWDRTANVRLEVKGHLTADFDSPVELWKSALEQEQANSREYFKIMSEARELKDYVTEQFIQSFFIPEQLAEEQAVEEILQNTLLVMKRGPDLYFELDRDMPQKPH